MPKPEEIKHGVPKQVENAINEYSQGFFLVTIAEDGEFTVQSCLENSMQNLAMLNFLNILVQETTSKLGTDYAVSAGLVPGAEDDD